jgi:hypothetical protein
MVHCYFPKTTILGLIIKLFTNRWFIYKHKLYPYQKNQLLAPQASHIFN